MADIFISYARNDRSRAQLLAETLEARGWSVWLDTRVKAGEVWDQVIEQELNAARCLVVLWSKNSVSQQWVRVEANEGLQRRILVPALIEDVRPPRAFRLVQAEQLLDWSGEPSHAGLNRLLATISKRLQTVVAQPDAMPSDPEGANTLLTPTESNTPIAFTITIDRNYATTYTIGEADHLIARLSTLLELPKPARILNIEEGSVKITIEISIEQAHKLIFLQKSGMLDKFGIEDVGMIGDAAAAAIVASKRADGTYDVFMCHNADDKREVIRIGVKLRSRGKAYAVASGLISML